MGDNAELLLKYLIKEDNRGYTLLYQMFYVPMILFAERYVGEEEVAKDLVQEVFISLLGQKKDFQNLTALKVYLYNAVKNKCIDYLRHEAVKNRFAAFMTKEVGSIDVFWDRVLEEDVYARLISAVNTLPPQYRRTILLSLEGCKISEVAEKMKISLDTAKEYKKEGKKRLKAQLQHLSYLVLLPVINSL